MFAICIADDGILDMETYVNRHPTNPQPPHPAILRLLEAHSVPKMSERALVFEDAEGVRYPLLSTFMGDTARFLTTELFSLDDGPTAEMVDTMADFYRIALSTTVPFVVRHNGEHHDISVIGVEMEAMVLSVRNDHSAPHMLRMPTPSNLLPFMRDLELVMFVE